MSTCEHPKEDRYFTDDSLLEWCGLCGEVVTDHHERKYGEPHPEHFPKRGGTRPGAGRPFNELPSHRIVIHATDDELTQIMALSPRERTEKMTTMVEIMFPDDDCLISGQHIWLGEDEVACLSTPSATLVNDEQAKEWVDQHFPGFSWKWI